MSKKTLLKIGGATLFAYLTALLFLVSLERSMVFPAPPPNAGDWDVAHCNAQEQYVKSEDGTEVHVWSLVQPGAKATLIFCHGNAESLGLLSSELALIRDTWKVNVVAFDYRGYGKTQGTSSERGVLADARAVGQWVADHKLFQRTQRVALGRSLGGAMALEIAVETKTDALILDRTFSSAVDVAADKYPIFPVRWLMQNPLRSIDKIPQYSKPLLQMHGKIDEVIPYYLGKKLFDRCPSQDKKFLTLEDLGHQHPWPKEFWKEGRDFIERLTQ